MTYSIPDCFMIAFLCGTVFGLVYEFFRLIRRIFPIKAVTFICDVCFFTIAAFVILNLSLYLGNYIRIYTILGFGCGVFAYIQTIGRLVSTLEMVIGKIFKRFAATIYKVFAKPISAFAHKTAQQFGKINDFFTTKAKKAFSLLQFRHQKLYNRKRNITTSIDDKKTGENFGGKNVIHAKVFRGK